MVSPLRIAVVAACPFTLRRGTPIRIQRMAEALAERGHEVHVVTYHLGGDDYSAQLRVHRTPEDRHYAKLGPGPSVRKLAVVDRALYHLLKNVLREQKIDVIHAHHYEGLMVAAAARRGTRIPLVYDAHTLLMSELPFYSLGLPAGVKRGLGRWLDRKVPLLADHTVCVTEAIRDKLVRDADYDPGRATVITNGVEFEHFDIAGRQAAPAQQGQMITFTGNMAEYQGIDLLLKAFARVISRKPQARLQIVTDGSFASYEPLAHELGVRGQIDLVLSPSFAELPAIIAAADVAVNPRPYMDGVPVKLLNYMAAGRAVVSFDASAPGVVHGQTGWLARSGDAAEFGDGILRLLDDPALAARIGTEARRYVFENCRWPVVAERCETLYQRLLEATA